MGIQTYQESRQAMSDAKFFMDYSRWMDGENRYEQWPDAVKRVMDMHRTKYKDVMTPQLAEYIDFAEQAYLDKLILGSQRALQFGGEQIFKHEARLYNCSFSYADRPRFFQETMYLLLAGCGVGFSVQKHHVAKLPSIKPVSKKCEIFVVPDSIEGWADAFGVLLSSYFDSDNVPFPEYRNKIVYFDYSEIRPKGAYISGGFQAPGPDGLQAAVEKCRKLIERILASGSNHLRPIDVYDFVMHMADAVLSGGVRRAATICIFSKDDDEMLKAKTGNWYKENPQRARSNNSVLLVRGDLTRDEWSKIMTSVRDFGEPGFIFAENTEFGFNPCVEIGMWAYDENGVSGFQFCNLIEQNGSMITSLEMLLRSAKASAILGTLQAGYTNFTYLDDATRRITEREALLGCSITGWMNNPDVLFNEDNMREAAEVIKNINKEVAAMIGINQAARTTTTKPAGNSSTLLMCESGIGGAHAPRYIRNVQMNKQGAVVKMMQDLNPKMVEESVWSADKTDMVISFPVVSKEGSIFKSDLYGVKQLEYVKRAQQIWIEAGTNVELCVHPKLRHNISNTISVDDWDEVEEYIYNNRQYFAGISLLSATGDKDYAQAPYTEVFTAEQLATHYGAAAIFASGLIVDGMHAFNNDLWNACATALGYGDDIGEGSAAERGHKGLPVTLEETSDLSVKRDWVRRCRKFAKNYFDNDVRKATYCLKDVHNLHRWEAIIRNFKSPDFSKLPRKDYVAVDTMAAVGCNGGACEITF